MCIQQVCCLAAGMCRSVAYYGQAKVIKCKERVICKLPECVNGFSCT